MDDLTRSVNGRTLAVELTTSGEPVAVGDFTIHAHVNAYGPDEANELARFVRWRGGPIAAQVTGLAEAEELRALAELLTEYTARPE